MPRPVINLGDALYTSDGFGNTTKITLSAFFRHTDGRIYALVSAPVNHHMPDHVQAPVYLEPGYKNKKNRNGFGSIVNIDLKQNWNLGRYFRTVIVDSYYTKKETMRAELKPIDSAYTGSEENFEEIEIGVENGKKRAGLITGKATAYEIDKYTRPNVLFANVKNASGINSGNPIFSQHNVLIGFTIQRVRDQQQKTYVAVKASDFGATLNLPFYAPAA